MLDPDVNALRTETGRRADLSRRLRLDRVLLELAINMFIFTRCLALNVVYCEPTLTQAELGVGAVSH